MVYAILTVVKTMKTANVNPLTLLFFVVIFTHSVYASFECGNSICDITETHYSCPQDCLSGSKDNYCDATTDSRCDPDCIRSDPDCLDYQPSTIQEIVPAPISIEQEYNSLIILGLAAVILFFLFIIFLKVIREKPKDYLDRKKKPGEIADAPDPRAPSSNPFDKYKYMYKK